jgi:DHA2 family multidrug resistance protein
MGEGPRLPLLLTAIAITAANFMNVLDTTIAVVSLPAISGSLGATPSQGAWVLTSYSVCLAVILPLSPWISRRYGEIRTFVASVIMFSITSMLCGIAPNFESLILFRALQGLSSGLIVPLSQTLVLRVYPPAQHGFAIGLWSVTSTTAPVLGPLIGGYITDNFGWPWIFYINIPLGIVTGTIIWTSLAHIDKASSRIPVDGMGILLLAVVVIMMQLVLDKGHELDWLASPAIRLMTNVAIIGAIAFYLWERREPHPIIDYSLFRYPVFVMASIMASLFHITYFGSMIPYPIWMQSVLGYTATWSGLVMAGTSVLPVFGMMVVGKNMSRLNLRYLMASGALCGLYGIYLQAGCTTDTAFADMLWARVVIGVGFTLLWPPIMALTLSSVPPDKTTSAASFFNFFRIFSTSVGIAIGITLWQSRTVFHRQHMVEELIPWKPGKELAFQPLENLADGDNSVLWGIAEGLTNLQALTMGLSDTFMLLAILVIPVVLLVPFLPAKMPTSGRAAPIGGE